MWSKQVTQNENLQRLFIQFATEQGSRPPSLALGRESKAAGSFVEKEREAAGVLTGGPQHRKLEAGSAGAGNAL